MKIINPNEKSMQSFYEEFGTTKEQVQKDVQLIKLWLQQQPHLPNVEDDEMLSNMLLRCKFSVERAKQKLDMHFTVKGLLPELFGNRDPLGPEILAANDLYQNFMLPLPTPDGYRVIMTCFPRKDMSDLSQETSWKISFMVSDLQLLVDRSIGNLLIVDQKNVSVEFMLKLTLPLLKKVEAATKGYSFRVKGIHILNAAPGMDTILHMGKAILKSKLVSRTHIHANLESLYKFVDKKILPKEYGGEEKSCNELSLEVVQWLNSKRDWFLAQESAKADESKRPGKSIKATDLFGFEGTFKKLSVD